LKLSTPIFRLKRKARLLSREAGIPLHRALDRIATAEGYESWSLLAAKASGAAPGGILFERLGHGDMLLVGARPGQGKTLLSLRLAVEAMLSGNRSFFFTLEYTERDVAQRFRSLGADPAAFGGLFEFDSSEAIGSDHIQRRLEAARPGTLAVVDYLQLLDQDRRKPELAVQLRALKSFARERGLVLAFISQIDRSYDPAAKPCPDLADIRMPNPFDPAIFDKALFLHNGEVRFLAIN